VASGLKQTQYAARLAVSDTTLRAWERGEQVPSGEKIEESVLNGLEGLKLFRKYGPESGVLSGLTLTREFVAERILEGRLAIRDLKRETQLALVEVSSDLHAVPELEEIEEGQKETYSIGAASDELRSREPEQKDAVEEAPGPREETTDGRMARGLAQTKENQKESGTVVSASDGQLLRRLLTSSISYAFVIAILLFIIATLVTALWQSRASKIHIMVVSPTQGAHVEMTVRVEGQVSDPSAVVRLLVYPENGGDLFVMPVPVVDANGRFTGQVRLGDANEGAGQWFNVIVLANTQGGELDELMPEQRLRSQPQGEGTNSIVIRLYRTK
jgi:hypothetical protein